MSHQRTIERLAVDYWPGACGERQPLQVPLTSGFTAWRELITPYPDAEQTPPDLRYGPQWYFVLNGPAGAVSLEVGRHRLLSGTCAHCRRFPTIRLVDNGGTCWHAAWLDRHATHPRYDGEVPSSQPCPFTGRICYVDGSPLQADLVARRWLESGRSDEVLVIEMREFYTAWLGER